MSNLFIETVENAPANNWWWLGVDKQMRLALRRAVWREVRSTSRAFIIRLLYLQVALDKSLTPRFKSAV